MGVCGIYVSLWSLYHSIIMGNWMTERTNALNQCYGIMDSFY